MKVVLVGASGRMGQEVAKILTQKKHLSISMDDVSTSKDSKAAHVVIDFSSPEGFKKALNLAVNNRIPFVSGTTGLSDEDFKLLTAAAAQVPVLWSSNMSLGINFIKKLLSQFSSLEDFDFYVEEIHHNRKKDNPGGTAITLHEVLEKAVGKNIPKPVGIRGGGVIGIHRILAMSDEEVITIEHNALQRSVFAKGAVLAAEWLANQSPGFYQMSDFLDGAKKTN